MFLHAIVTLSTLLQYSRRSAQAYYLRGKCYYCLFDYKSAYIDITECLEIHRSENRAKYGVSVDTKKLTPGWLNEFHEMLLKKISSGSQETGGRNTTSG